MPPPLPPPLLPCQEILFHRYQIIRQIGEGTYSQIFAALDLHTRTPVAVKVELPLPQSGLNGMLAGEAECLQSIQKETSFCRFHTYGKVNVMSHEMKNMNMEMKTMEMDKDNMHLEILIMEKCGDNMSKLRKKNGVGMSLQKVKEIALQMLSQIEKLHAFGYVHRDIKASNFVLDAKNGTNYILIDFGLARSFLDEEGHLRNPRPTADFRGTSMYASLTTHYGKELGRKDDLWSWLYLILDFLRVELPWRQDAQLKNKKAVLQLKQHYTEKDAQALVEGLPGEDQLLEMMSYLKTLTYADVPDYKHLKTLIGTMSNVTKSCVSKRGKEQMALEKACSKWNEMELYQVAIGWKRDMQKVIEKRVNDCMMKELFELFC